LTNSTDAGLSVDQKQGLGWAAAASAEQVLAAQKRSLELVLQGAPVGEVLAELTRIVESTGRGEAFVAVLVRNGDGALRTAAAPRLPAAFADALSKIDPAQLGTLGLSAATGVTAVMQDIAADPGWWSPLRPLAETLGLKAAWSHPIVTRDSKVLGGFVTFFREHRRPSASELRLVETLSQTAALAIERHESEAIMARQRRTLDLAMEAAEMGAWRYTVADNICMYDERAQVLYGLSDGRFLHDEENVKRLFHPDDLAPMWSAVAVAVDPRGEGRYDVEYRVPKPGGGWRWLSAWGIVEFEGEGTERRPVAITGASRDISKIKEAEEHQRLLVSELSHRVKNTLATIQSIARYTFKSDADPASMKQSFDARILSLSRAHELLTEQSWAGAELKEIVARAIEPFSPERFEVEGPSIQMPTRKALALAMGLHELSTNAVKHGALATPAGRVQLAWRLADDTLTLNWRERGGGPVSAPKRRGFGSLLLEQAVASDLGGTTKLEYLPDGVRWEAVAPLAR